jgi:hypothetical protein
MALMYLINKPQVFGRLSIWLLLFLEYDFKIVYKLGRSYLMVDALNRLPNILNMLKYLIKLVMFICSPYNLNGYIIFMNIY